MQNVHDIRKDRVTEHMGYRIPGFRFGPPKTHRSKRPVSLPTELMPNLLAWKSVQAQQRLAANVWVDLDLVFTNEIGLPIAKELLGISGFWRSIGEQLTSSSVYRRHDDTRLRSWAPPRMAWITRRITDRGRVWRGAPSRTCPARGRSFSPPV
jgi:hypothetical protein